jgi:Ca2+-binding RTX toxin-like protein
MAIFGTTGDDKLEGTEIADTIIAYAGDDELHGKGGNDLLSGDDGNDRLFGEADNDLLFGGLDVGRDSDTLDGGGGIDTVSYGQVQHGMFASLEAGAARTRGGSGDFPVDKLISVENVTGTNFGDFLAGNGGANGLSGSGGNDSIEGKGGNDKLSGGTGTDDLDGGSGVDKLTGGADADLFQYFGTSDSGVGLGKRDVITDFSHAQGDKIELRFMDARVGTSGDQAFDFIGSDGFTAEGQVRAFVEGDHTVVALNTSGSGGSEAQIELTGNFALVEGDFVL